MKMILNNRYFGKSLLLVSACSLWMLGACTGDFMETNTDPNAVTEEELGYDNTGYGINDNADAVSDVSMYYKRSEYRCQ
ncbi:hypothetical protein NXW78_25275 [Bacteroides ovatus]|nr:hypothetical protein [Bacteroides ovatus]